MTTAFSQSAAVGKISLELGDSWPSALTRWYFYTDDAHTTLDTSVPGSDTYSFSVIANGVTYDATVTPGPSSSGYIDVAMSLTQLSSIGRGSFYWQLRKTNGAFSRRLAHGEFALL